MPAWFNNPMPIHSFVLQVLYKRDRTSLLHLLRCAMPAPQAT